MGFVCLIISFKEKVVLNPEIWIQEYARFLGTLTIAILSFYVIHVYWQKKKEELDNYTLQSELEWCFDDFFGLIIVFDRNLNSYENGVMEVKNALKENIFDLEKMDSAISKKINKIYRTEVNASLKNRIDWYKKTIVPSLRLLLKRWDDIDDIHTFWGSESQNLHQLKINMKKIVVDREGVYGK